ncbi:MAG TPA: ABC transporter ATP-binding protein [Mycobacteriales bacterium]|nr:ABC transporter ATP-binding protein [Mycobacteriales bacterium]
MSEAPPRTKRRSATRAMGKVVTKATPKPSADTTNDTKSTEARRSRPEWLRWLSPYVLKYRGDLIATLIAAVLWVGTVVALPLVQKIIIDDAIVGSSKPFIPLIVLLVGLGVGRFATAAIWRYQGGRVSLGVVFDMRRDLYNHLQRLDAAGHAHLQSGQLVSRANSDVMLVQQLVSWLPMVTGNLLKVVLALGVMAFLSPILSAVVAAVLAIVFVLTRHLRRKSYAAGWDSQQREADMVTAVEEAVTGVRVVKGFGQENAEFTRFTHRLTSMFGSRVRAIRVRAPFLAHLQAAPLLGQVMVLGLGGWLALNGHLTVGTFVAFAAYLADLSGSVRALGSVITMAPLARSGTERIAELINLNSLVQEKPDAVAPERGGGRVEFEHVDFHYPESDRPVLTDLNFTAEPGETVAIVGPSGAGKSTALQLMLRLRDTSGGTVRIEDTDVRDWQLPTLRGRIGIVFENSFLFSESIGANISYAKPDATQEEIEAAAKAASVHDFIATLPEGYDTQVGENGLALSGGQRQRIALARALLADPDVLILDDATSAVDVKVEKQIHDNLKPLLAGRTTIIVAYRESTVRLADRVLVMDEGHVVAEGRHEDLIESSPVYQRLFGDAQASGGSTDENAVDQVTPEAWIAPEDDAYHGFGDPPTPELLDAVRSLPPIVDAPEIDPQDEADHSEGFKLTGFLRPHWKPLLIGLLLVFIDAVATLVGPLLVRDGVDASLVHHSATALVVVCAAYLGVALVDWWDMWATTLYTSRTTERLLFALRVRIFAHLQKLGVDFYDRTQAGRLMTRITSDVDTVTQLFQIGLINALVAIVTCLGMAAALFILNPMLALVVLCVVPPAAIATVWYRRSAGPAYDRAREKMSEMNSLLAEGIAGVRVTQAFVREDVNLDTYTTVAHKQMHESKLALRTTSLYVSIIDLLSVLAIAATLVVGGHFVHTGTLEIGALLAFLLYLAQVFAPIQQLSAVFDVYQRAKVGLSRIGGLLAQTTSTPEPENPAEPGRIRGEIELEGVTLQYAGVRAPALKTVDLQIPAGQRVAFVGQTGAGKSTIAKLMTRFYDPTGGRVLVDGAPLPSYDLNSFRRQLGYVPQEPLLFSRSIRDNIAYGRPDATDAMVERAARAVGAHEFITHLDGGYLHVVQERGRSLSAGQRQLICLARALLVDPSILILDEATSNLDLASEGQVNQAMRVVSAGRTTIVIAHRPQSLQWVDRVVTVHDGHIVDERMQVAA